MSTWRRAGKRHVLQLYSRRVLQPAEWQWCSCPCVYGRQRRCRTGTCPWDGMASVWLRSCVTSAVWHNSVRGVTNVFFGNSASPRQNSLSTSTTGIQKKVTLPVLTKPWLQHSTHTKQPQLAAAGAAGHAPAFADCTGKRDPGCAFHKHVPISAGLLCWSPAACRHSSRNSPGTAVYSHAPQLFFSASIKGSRKGKGSGPKTCRHRHAATTAQSNATSCQLLICNSLFCLYYLACILLHLRGLSVLGIVLPCPAPGSRATARG
jgi:hypothetical protein